MSKDSNAIFGTLDSPSYKGCGISRQSQSGHQDYLHLVGGTCAEEQNLTVDRFCGGALDCAKALNNDAYEAHGSFTVCSKIFHYLKFMVVEF